ncbi:Histone acetyltransferase MCC1 (Protein MEIOTIC CONTROL OF CROSSOVERS 1) [Durusdinium trenchii]
MAVLLGEQQILLGATTFRTKFPEPRYDMDSVLQGGIDACMSGAAGYILTLGVVEGARGRGLAQALLRKTIEAIQAQLPQLKAIWVHVISYNHPAISLYERMGLQLVRRFPRFYNFHDQVWDSFLYVLYEKGGRPPENLALELLKEEAASTSEVSPASPDSPDSPTELPGPPDEKDLDVALQQLKYCEREHAYLQQMLGYDDVMFREEPRGTGSKHLVEPSLLLRCTDVVR